MALKPAQTEGLRAAAGRIAEPVTDWLLKDIAGRIAAAGRMTSTAAYELYRAEALGQARRGLKKFLKRQLGVSNKQIRQLFRQAARLAGEDDYRRAGKEFDFADSGLARMADAAAALAKQDFANLTQTLGMTAPDGRAYPLQKTYQKAMDFAFEKVFTGAQDYESAIRDATRQLADKGVRVIDYESGVHTGLEAAVRRNIMGGLGLMVEQIEQKNHDALGCDGWEISAHLNSAPDHEPYQGRQFSDAEFAALNGTAEHPGKLKRRIGTLNCGHVASPIILGVDSPQYTDEELAEMRRKNAEGITFEGRHYTGYEATQMQRRLEVAIRQQKRRIITAQAAGDEAGLLRAKVRSQILNQRYAEFSRAAGLRTQEQRLEVAGFRKGKDGVELRESGGVPGKGEAAGISVTGFTNTAELGILDASQKMGVNEDVNFVCRLDKKLYSVVSSHIETSEVIITEQQILHINEGHPGMYEKLATYLEEIIQNPDYILRANRPNSALVLKRIELEGTVAEVVLRLKVTGDPKEYKNSIISLWGISEKRYRRLLRQSEILYKHESI